MSPPLDGYYELNPRRPAVGQGDGAFGTYREKRGGGAGWHHGIDIAAPIGTPVRSATPGRVIRADERPGGYGKMIAIQDANGRITRYAHLSRIGAKVGDSVDQRQAIGLTGTSGNPPKHGAPHLHFEVIQNGEAVNPDFYFGREGRAKGRPLNPYLQELIYGLG